MKILPLKMMILPVMISLYDSFRGWVIPDEKNRLRLAVREAVGKRVVEHVKREMVSVVKTWVDKDSYGALQVQVSIS